MKLYFMRHGNSPSAQEAGVSSDFDRPLSPRGREDARAAADFLQSKGGRPGLIVVSPFTRAQQTSAETGPKLDGQPEIKTYEPLSNQIDGASLCRRVDEDQLGVEELLLIGHQPQLGEAAAYLTGSYIDLKPAGMIAVETTTPGKGTLLWSANPADFAPAG